MSGPMAAIATRILPALLALSGVAGVAADRAGDDDAAAALFTDAAVPRLEVRLSEEARTSLRTEPRHWTTCTLVADGDTVHEQVAIRIKGGAGSFRDVDDRPALTLDMDRHARHRRFHGLDRFHLNNAVQDDSYLRELLGSGIFKEAGIPAPRVTHARVWIDGRDVGLYVLKEAYDLEFLRRSFPRPDGNLYDGGFGQDIDEELERDEGRRGDEGEDAAALAAACRLVDDDDRWRSIEQRLDRDTFLTFSALEALIGHWDGYCNAANNYRLYFDPAVEGRARFLPHGMDQIFGDPGMSVRDPPYGLVAAAVLENVEWRRRYRERIRELLPLVAAEERLLPVVDAAAARLRPIVIDMGPEARERFTAAVGQLRDILVARGTDLAAQVDAPDPVVWPTRLQAAMRSFDAEAIADATATADRHAVRALRAHVPWFECPDSGLEHRIYRRWCTLLRHIRHTDDGPVLDDLPAGFGDPLIEARWLRDLRLVFPAAPPDGPPVTPDERTCDDVITIAVGLKVHPDGTIEIDPHPPDAWPWFAIDRLPYHGRRLAILWDETGEHYGRGGGLRVFVDDTEVAQRETLGRLIARLPD